MQRVFVPWWILIVAAGLYVGLALADILDGPSWATLLWLALAALSVRVGLVNRRRLAELERQRLL